jgi:mannose-6-phosphate isomerase-like protein (cupin superfamily)
VIGVMGICACGTPATAGRIVDPRGVAEAAVWSAAEQQKDVAVRTLHVSDTASVHLVRLARAEKPHVHEDSDLAVFVLRGSVHMHFGERVIPVVAGDVIEIPRGASHWAENAGDSPSEAYVVFSPPSKPPPADAGAR